ncbi:MAG: group II intron reverse transcriptase domain-containing protein, partial [Dehalococcoidia bacterium]|nr:group II intron reverse transcriptase domain-containing protein [Dehalococcoidia bacterium]
MRRPWEWCFDNIDHEVLLSVLDEKLHDNCFLRLLKYLLKAGYVEDWKYGRTLSGTPQGGIVSPVLANIYLDRLDKHVETVLIPAHTRGAQRRPNPAWNALRSGMVYHGEMGHHRLATELRQQMQQ